GTALYLYNDQSITNDATKISDAAPKQQLAVSNNEVVATYKGGDITINEINEKLDLFTAGNLTTKFEEMPTEIQKSMAEGIVVNELIKSEAEKTGLYKSEKINKMVSHLRDQLVQKEFVEQKIDSELTPEKIKEHYSDLAHKSSGQQEVKFRNIVIGDEPKAKVAHAKLKKGSDFAKVAEEFATNGKDAGKEIGFMRAGTHLPQVEEQLFTKLKVNETSEPFKTEFGWHIVQLTDRRQVTIPPLEEIKSQVMQDLKQKLLQDYMATVLKDSNFSMTWQPPAAPVNDNAAGNVGTGENTDTKVDATLSQAAPSADETPSKTGLGVNKQQSKEG
ncbi:MAG: peptidyl-prolyl cis-trans isomerase, partial [Pseudomonadota bacterium]